MDNYFVYTTILLAFCIGEATFAQSVADLVKDRDALVEKQSYLTDSLLNELAEHDGKLKTISEGCSQKLMDAQLLPEKVEDAACLKAWMEEMQGQLAHKDATKPIGERLEEAHNNVVRANIKIIEAKIAQKK